eukprot:11205096-Lingulodinium_polyedra.AAC.1
MGAVVVHPHGSEVDALRPRKLGQERKPIHPPISSSDSESARELPLNNPSGPSGAEFEWA